MSEQEKHEWRIEATRKWTEARVLHNGEDIPFSEAGFYIAKGGPGPDMWLTVERAMVRAWNDTGDLDIDVLYPPVSGHPAVLTLGIAPHQVTYEGSPVVFLKVGNRRFRVIEETSIGDLDDGLFGERRAAGNAHQPF